jgi:hypothetical protein
MSGGPSQPGRALAVCAEPIPASLIAGDRQLILEIIEHCSPPDLVQRLRQFHQAHADVDIVRREGTWQATIHAPGSVRTVVRWELRELLDFLDQWSQAASAAGGFA